MKRVLSVSIAKNYYVLLQENINYRKGSLKFMRHYLALANSSRRKGKNPSQLRACYNYDQFSVQHHFKTKQQLRQ